MTDIDLKDTSYSLVKEDPELLLGLIDKYVKLQLINNCCYAGFIHSLDPITNSIILLTPQEETFKTIILPGHAILDITEAVLSDDIKPPQKIELHGETKEEIMLRRKKLMAWFEKNLLPVLEVDDKIVIGDVTLLPPYTSLDLCTDNPIVALQIRNILKRMPEDFES